MKNMKRLAIIPARGGSKRIKNKNIKDFCGQPMINHIINAAKGSKLFDKIHVSTESLLIKEVVERNGISIDFMRPERLSDDFTPLMPVISFAVDSYNNMNIKFDEVWLLMACAPLIDKDDLIAASKVYAAQDINSIRPLLAIAEYPAPIEWSFLKDSKNILHPRYEGKFKERSQDLPKSYYDSGTFIIFPQNFILEIGDDGSDKDYIGYELPFSKAIDIDTQKDWDLAEAFFRSRNYKK